LTIVGPSDGEAARAEEAGENGVEKEAHHKFRRMEFVNA
jgi:hypothetical protein